MVVLDFSNKELDVLRADYPVIYDLVRSHASGKSRREADALGGKGGFFVPKAKKMREAGYQLFLRMRKKCTIKARWYVEQKDQYFRETYGLSDTPESLISVRLSVLIKILKKMNQLHKMMPIFELVHADYFIMSAFCIQFILFPHEYRPYIVLAQLDQYDQVDRLDLIKVEKSWDVAKTDAELTREQVQFWSEGSRQYGLPARLKDDEVKTDLKDWLTVVKEGKFLEHRDLFISKLKQPMLNKVVTKDSFLTWVLNSANWARAGSSSEGRVSGTVDDDGEITDVEFKATKNVIPLIINLVELVAKAQNQPIDKVMEMVIQKVEPAAKPRTAAAAELIEYLVDTWVFQHYEKRSLIPEMILQESTHEEYQRYLLTLASIKNMYGVSFDYKGFDTQPTQQELSILLLSLALTGPDVAMAYRALALFQKQWVWYRKSDGSIDSAKVVHGLVSGLFMTGLLGSAYNFAASTTASELSGAYPIFMRIKGDDNASVFRTYIEALSWLSTMLANGIKAKPDIFGIVYQRVELLRKMFDGFEGSVFGYLLRINLNLGKDWNEPPSSDQDRISTVLGKLKVLWDRGVRGEGFEAFLDEELRFWSWKHKLAQHWTNIPSLLRGTGIWTYQWKGEYYVRNQKLVGLNKPRPYKFELSNPVSPTQKLNWRATLARYGIEPSDQEYHTMASSVVQSMLGANRLPTSVKDRYKKVFVPKDITRKQAQIIPVSSVYYNKTFDLVLTGFKTSAHPLLGRFSFLGKDLTALKLYKQANPDATIIKMLYRLHPELEQYVRKVERVVGSRTMALDILIFGKCPTVRPLMSKFHADLLTQYVENIMVETIWLARDKIAMADLLFTSMDLFNLIAARNPLPFKEYL
jgi:hypothetical protein